MVSIEELKKMNRAPLHSVRDGAFMPYGKLVTAYPKEDIEEAVAYLSEKTDIPEAGNIYVASDPEFEKLPLFEKMRTISYGGMPIQLGYCNGRNTTYNGFEYHKGSELNLAATDFILVLGHTWDIREGGFYDNDDAKLFFVEKGMLIEMYETTLHLSPCRVTDEGFRAAVVLPKGTNTPLSEEEKDKAKALATDADYEGKLLLQKNKWVIAHPKREPLIKQGAFAGIIGENREVLYK